ncbi:RnfABCDGE type electron transport complex subunit D [bacterium]|nr:RnfABCDGE type electron transport complex subunit D [bacterium]
MADNKLAVAVSPHVREDISIRKIMFGVLLALLPALAGSVYFYGIKALWLSLIGVASALAAEAIFQLIRGVHIDVTDGSAAITGLLLAFNLPPDVPYWMPVIGAFVGIMIGKQLFGGLGRNILNPALVGRAFLMASWPVDMTTKWIVPRFGTLSGIDTVTSATPLNVFKSMQSVIANPEATAVELGNAQQTLQQLGSNWSNMFFGNIGGCLGETSAVLLLIGGIYLLIKNYADWRIPLSYIGSVALLSWAFMGSNGLFSGAVPFHIFSGGLMLGAFFMATDMVTTPITPRGRWIFGIGCGIFTFVIRKWGGYPEGVSYSILLMNIAAPLIDRYTKPRVLGYHKKPKEEKKAE